MLKISLKISGGKYFNTPKREISALFKKYKLGPTIKFFEFLWVLNAFLEIIDTNHARLKKS